MEELEALVVYLVVAVEVEEVAVAVAGLNP
jgi:hypothetical protein